MNETVYLDYAATSAIRPPEVAEAVVDYLYSVGATPGRSGHARALEAGRVALRCRKAIAELFSIGGDPGRIAFQLNATHALNVALQGAAGVGDTIVRTTLDHNAVRRPVAALAMRGVEERILEVDARGQWDEAQLARLLGEGKGRRILAVPHASNVTGAILAVRRMADIAHGFDALVIVDAAQSAGHRPVDVDELGADILAFSGHKGLLGPQGTGGLWVRDGIDISPILSGGTGGDSSPDTMPASYPDHLEAGSQNGPGIAGLRAGVEWLIEHGVESGEQKAAELKLRLVRGLSDNPQVTILSPTDVPSVAIVMIDVRGYDAAEMAGLLDRRFGIQVRAGLHCAPEAHRILGSSESGGLRLSIGWATTAEEIDRATSAIKELTSESE